MLLERFLDSGLKARPVAPTFLPGYEENIQESVAGEWAASRGLAVAGRLPSLTVPVGQQLHLTTAPGLASAITPAILFTDEPEQFKDWIGNDDATARNFTAPPPRPVPPAWEGGSQTAPQALNLSDYANLEAAAWHYFFADRSKVASYFKLIRKLGPFNAALYACAELHIATAASLIISGIPAILLIDRLIIEDGGALQSFGVVKAVVGRLEKRSTTTASSAH